MNLYGDLNFYFANAGVVGSISKSIADMSAENFERTLRINVSSVFLAIKYASKVMKEKGHGGSIICTSSVAGNCCY